MAAHYRPRDNLDSSPPQHSFGLAVQNGIQGGYTPTPPPQPHWPPIFGGHPPLPPSGPAPFHRGPPPVPPPLTTPRPALLAHPPGYTYAQLYPQPPQIPLMPSIFGGGHPAGAHRASGYSPPTGMRAPLRYSEEGEPIVGPRVQDRAASREGVQGDHHHHSRTSPAKRGSYPSPQQPPPSFPYPLLDLPPVPGPPLDHPLAPALDALHQDVMWFVREVEPTIPEREERWHIFMQVQRCVHQELYQYPSARAHLFGSAASNLSTHKSDLDIVVSGVMEPDPFVGFFEREDRPKVVHLLQKLERPFRRSLPVARCQIIRNARIPVMKLELYSGVSLDISLGGSAGPEAAALILEQGRYWPALRPLVLVLKSLLKQHGLNEVATGGLGGYSLANLVLGHLQEEQKKRQHTGHLGLMLLRFLDRFGQEFDYRYDCVSVQHGGIVTKMEFGYPEDGKLAVRDALTGREIAGGSHRITEVQSLWMNCAKSLHEMLEDHVAAKAHGPGASRKLGQLLGAGLDVEMAVAREQQGVGHTGPGASNGASQLRGPKRRRSE